MRPSKSAKRRVAPDMPVGTGSADRFVASKPSASSVGTAVAEPGAASAAVWRSTGQAFR